MATDAVASFKRSKLPPNPSSTLLDSHMGMLQYSPLGSKRVAERRAAKEKEADLAKNLVEQPWKLSTNTEQGEGGQAADFHGLASLCRSPHKDRDVILRMAEQLQAERERFNLAWGHREPDAPIVEFLVAAAQAAHQLYGKFFDQLAKKATTQCEEQGLLLCAIWNGCTSMLEATLLQMREQCMLFRNRLEELEGRQAIHESSLLEEIDSLKNRVGRLQTTGSGEKLSMRKSLMPADFASILGPAAGQTSKRPTVVRFQTSSPEGDAETTGAANPIADPLDLATPSNAALCTFQQIHESPMPAAVANLRRGSVAEGLKTGNRRASVVASNLLKQLQVPDEQHGSVSNEDEIDQQARNEALKTQLQECRAELFEVYEQISKLEAIADQAVLLESRAEAAESERDDLLEKSQTFTPRPLPSFASYDPPLNEEAAAKLQEAMSFCRGWPAVEIALLVVGEQAGGGSSVMQEAPFAFGCLNAPLLGDELTRAALLEALDAAVVRPLSSFLTQQQLTWLESYLEEHQAVDSQRLAAFLTAFSKTGYEYVEKLYACVAAAQPGLTIEKVTSIIEAASLRTTVRVAAMEEENRALRAEVQQFRAAASMQAELEARTERNKQLRDEETRSEKPNPLELYLELLASSDDASVKEGLMGMGTAQDVPKLFRCNGRVRNKQMSKRETEKMVKEIWKDKLNEMRAGKHTDLAEFVFQHLQKRVGIVTAVVEMGYNLLYSVWKYSFDADCSLFLRILRGETNEDVYLQQITLQEDLDQLFAALDRTVHTVETETIPKADMATALEIFLRVGEPRGKTLQRFDALMQALEADQPGPVVSYKRLFEEDREYNQGEFAETVRAQFLEERLEYFREVQQLLFIEAANEDSASKGQLVRALCKADPDLSEKQAWSRANEVFAPGAENHRIKLLMKRLQAGAAKRERNSSAKMSTIPKGRNLAAKPKPKMNTAIQEAVEEVRLKMAGIKPVKPLQTVKSSAAELMKPVRTEPQAGRASAFKLSRKRGIRRLGTLHHTATL